ncbi:hypothetical protein JCM19238_314 [Vibrio ponticus]|nr:hypothetical protein JCM19238_314 [Vibrio ponticus]
MDLANKVIAITGAGQGLGQQMALSLAKCGANLALIDIELEGSLKLNSNARKWG